LPDLLEAQQQVKGHGAAHTAEKETDHRRHPGRKAAQGADQRLTALIEVKSIAEQGCELGNDIVMPDQGIIWRDNVLAPNLNSALYDPQLMRLAQRGGHTAVSSFVSACEKVLVNRFSFK